MQVRPYKNPLEEPCNEPFLVPTSTKFLYVLNRKHQTLTTRTSSSPSYYKKGDNA